MTKGRKPPKKPTRSRNPVARAVRTPRFRPRVEPKPGVYRRREKHPAAPPADEPEV